MRRLFAASVLVAALAGCQNDSVTDPGSVFGLDLQLSPPADTLQASGAGNTVQLTATATRQGVPLATLPGHVWETSDSAVATVDQTGMVRAVAPGTADIAVRVNSVRGYAKIVVVAPSTSGGGGGGGGGTLAFLGGGPGSIATGLDAACGIVTGGLTYCFGKAPLIGIAKDTSCFGRTGEWDEGPESCTLLPLPITPQIALSTLTMGDSVACGLAAGGAAYCWGDQTYGEIGNGITAEGTSTTPVAAGGGHSFTEISAGGAHVCGIAEGQAYCWGKDLTYQLGGGDLLAVNSSTPIRVAPTSGLTFTSITAGRDHTCALTGNGTAYCWGSNEEGQLGIGTIGGSVDDPLAVVGGLTFTQLSARGDNTCGVTSAATIYCWGANEAAQTGLPASATPTAAPNQILGAGYTYVAVGGRDTTALDGPMGHVCGLAGTTVSCWGSNRYGQLGRGSKNFGPFKDPVAIPGTYTALSSGTRTSCAVAADGAYCWGSAIYGATGAETQALAVISPTLTAPPR